MIEAQALQLILDTAKKANDAQMLNIESDGRTEYFRIGDEIKEITVKPKPRNHHVFSLPSLIEYAKTLTHHGVVWHGKDFINLVIDDDDRRDTVGFQIHFSSRFRLLQKLATEKTWFNQLAFIRMLRLDLGLDNLGIVSKFRRLAWSDGSTTAGEFVHGSDKLGKSINAQVENAADIPDETSISVPVYDEFPGEKYAVRCAIEIDSRNQVLLLAPLPGEIERIVTQTQEFIHDWLERELADESIDIYYGAK